MKIKYILMTLIFDLVVYIWILTISPLFFFFLTFYMNLLTHILFIYTNKYLSHNFFSVHNIYVHSTVLFYV